jgi:NADH dehydrogenase
VKQAARPAPRVVVIGAGEAGLTAATQLAKLPVELVVIDQRNHHLFQPLLYQVATAGLLPADIAIPIHSLFHGRRNIRVLLGYVDAIDILGSTVSVEGHRIVYNTLVLATGARHSYFGHDTWAAVAPGLKQLEDATAIRRRILVAFERAEATTDDAERQRLLTFAIVGAGLTGVELAGALAELARVALVRDFREIDTSDTRIMLIEAGNRVLPNFPPSLSAKAEAALVALGIEVKLNAPVSDCTTDGVMIANEFVPTATVLWAAGVMASPAATWLGAAHDRLGRAIVASDLTLPGHPEIFVIGDTASAQTADGRRCPASRLSRSNKVPMWHALLLHDSVAGR